MHLETCEHHRIILIAGAVEVDERGDLVVKPVSVEGLPPAWHLEPRSAWMCHHCNVSLFSLATVNAKREGLQIVSSRGEL